MIKRIKLRNFKSFKRAEIEFRDNFTVITGPNGSGKSNLIDSILFCLGTSSKVLRAERLTDLIRDGRGEAEVTIEIDGYEIKRRIRKTERGYYSYYYINDKSVSYSDVERLVESLGLNTDYNIVMQGDVTRIAEMTPIQRRKIIEDVAGISDFDEKKEKALKELEIVRQDIEKVEVVIREVEDQLSRLRVEREEALRYKSLLEERDRLEFYKKVHEHLSLLNEAERIRREIDFVESERDEKIRRIYEINSEIARLNDEVRDLSEKISSFKDERLRRINDEIGNVNSEIASLKRSIEIYEGELKELNGERNKVLVSIQKLSDEIEDIEKSIREFEVKRESLESILKEKVDRLNSLKVTFDKLSSDYRSLRDELDEKLKILNELKEKRTAILKEREKVLEGLRRIEIEIEEIESSRRKVRLGDVFDEIARDEKDLVIVKNEIDKVRMKIFDVDGEIFKLRDEISRIDEELKRCEIELAKVQKPRAVEIVLKACEDGKLDGIYGTVSQLCRVDERYSLALEVAGGNALNFIVVENEDVAIRALRYLKDVNGGRASFIPLNRIRVKLKLRPICMDGVVDYAVNLIDCDEKFRSVFELIYKDTLVVRDLDVAKKLINVFRVVTLEGDLIERSGVITGGSIKRYGLFDRRLREKIDELKRRREEIEFDLRRLENLRKELQERFESLNEKAMRLRERISANRSRVEELKVILADAEFRLKEKRRESEVLNDRAVEIERVLSDVEREISNFEREVEGLRVKLEDDRISSLSLKIEELRGEVERLKDLISMTNLEIEGLCARREQKFNILNDCKVRLSEIDEKVDRIVREVESAKVRIDELERNLEILKVKEREINREVYELRKRRDEIVSKIESLEREKNQNVISERILEERLKSLRVKLEEIERDLDVEIEVPENLPQLEYVERRIDEIERELESFGEVNMKSIQEYERVENRYRELLEKKKVLERERKEIIEKIRVIEEMKRSTFLSAFNSINENFKEIVRELADGEGEIYLDRDDPFSSGLQIRFKPFGKPIQRLESMSGGEKSLLTLAFIFAIQRFKPAPFYAFDEVDMFLDGVNVGRLAKMIRKLSSDAQFIVVSLRKPMLEESDHVVGVTRGGDGESIVTAIQLR